MLGDLKRTLELELARRQPQPSHAGSPATETRPEPEPELLVVQATPPEANREHVKAESVGPDAGIGGIMTLAPSQPPEADAPQDPYEAFRSAYPDYGGRFMDFIKGISSRPFLASPACIRQEPGEAFCMTTLSGLFRRLQTIYQQSRNSLAGLDAVLVYNQHTKVLRYNKNIINSENLDYARELYYDAVEAVELMARQRRVPRSKSPSPKPADGQPVPKGKSAPRRVDRCFYRARRSQS